MDIFISCIADVWLILLFWGAVGIGGYFYVK